jgi:hypothetical protein
VDQLGVRVQAIYSVGSLEKGSKGQILTYDIRSSAEIIGDKRSVSVFTEGLVRSDYSTSEGFCVFCLTRNDVAAVIKLGRRAIAPRPRLKPD